MKTLSTDTASVALGVERKVLDNLLAREARHLMEEGRRGKSRRIRIDVLERVAIALVLNRDLGVGLAKGIDLAARLVAAPSRPIAVGSLGSLTFDVARLRGALEHSVDEALESVAERTRGRPRS